MSKTELRHDRVFFKRFAVKEVFITKTFCTAGSVNSLLIMRQVIVHHDHNLLIRDAVLVDDLVGMACICLRVTQCNMRSEVRSLF